MSNAVKKRKVFYVAGFDPRPSKFYHFLYLREARKWSKLTGEKLYVSKMSSDEKHEHTFNIKNTKDNIDVSYSLLNWNYIAQQYWRISTLKLIFLFMAYYISLIRYGNWKYIFSNSQGRYRTLFIPVAMIFSVTLGASILFSSGFNFIFGNGQYLIIKILTGSLLFLFVSIALLKKIKPFWILRAMAFFYIMLKEENGALMKHLDLLAETISDFIKKEGEDYDEILFVSHSVGTIFVPVVLNKIRKRLNLSRFPENFSVLTLANQAMVATCYKQAKPFHRNMKELTQHTESLSWVDISSPADGVCVFGAEPFQPICSNEHINVALTTPRFHAVYSEEQYKKIKRNKFLLHFKYLCANEKNAQTNYFQITAGNKLLKEVFSV